MNSTYMIYACRLIVEVIITVMATLSGEKEDDKSTIYILTTGDL